MSGLRIEDLSIAIDRQQVLRQVNLEVEPGTCVGLVGESGSGKSMTALASLGLLPRQARFTGGRIFLGPQEIRSAAHDRAATVRGAGVAMIFQSPRAALNPVLRVGYQVERVLRRHGRRSTRRQRSIELLESVGLPDASTVADLYPHQLSGGMCQRVMIAMGIASEPQILIADEPTTALDVTVQADILDLLDDLIARTGMGMLLISHDISVVAERCQSISVMRKGDVVEAGPKESVINSPRHPFTAELVRDLVQSRPGSGTAALPASGPGLDSSEEAVG